MKRISYSISVFLACLCLGACGSTQVLKENQKSSEIAQKGNETNGLLDEKDANNKKNAPSSDRNASEIEFDTAGGDAMEVTMDFLIKQLQEDHIVSSSPSDLQDGATGAVRTTQIDTVILVEFSTKDLTYFQKAYNEKKITIQEKQYDVIAINRQFMLLLTDDQDASKAIESFLRSPSNDEGLLNF